MFNESITLLPSSARTATTNSNDINNRTSCGVHVIIDVTAASATPSVVFKIQGKDPLSGKYYDLLTSAAITGTGTTVLKVFPSATAATNLAVNDFLPKVWRVLATHADTDSITYSVSANLLKV